LSATRRNEAAEQPVANLILLAGLFSRLSHRSTVVCLSRVNSITACAMHRSVQRGVGQVLRLPMCSSGCVYRPRVRVIEQRAPCCRSDRRVFLGVGPLIPVPAALRVCRVLPMPVVSRARLKRHSVEGAKSTFERYAGVDDAGSSLRQSGHFIPTGFRRPV